MTGAEFDQFLKRHGISINRAAELFGVDRSTIKRLKNADTVPGPVALCCKLLAIKSNRKLAGL